MGLGFYIYVILVFMYCAVCITCWIRNGCIFSVAGDFFKWAKYAKEQMAKEQEQLAEEQRKEQEYKQEQLDKKRLWKQKKIKTALELQRILEIGLDK